MTLYTGLYTREGRIHRMTFEAVNDETAASLAREWNVGLEGKTELPNVKEPLPLPESYPLEVAQKLLGGVSRSTIYREIHLGLLDRVPNTRRVLITRQSIEARKSRTL